MIEPKRILIPEISPLRRLADAGEAELDRLFDAAAEIWITDIVIDEIERIEAETDILRGWIARNCERVHVQKTDTGDEYRKAMEAWRRVPGSPPELRPTPRKSDVLTALDAIEKALASGEKVVAVVDDRKIAAVLGEFDGVEVKKVPSLKTTPFDIADHLEDEETIAEYLSETSADSDPTVVAAAKSHAEQARLRIKKLQTTNVRLNVKDALKMPADGPRKRFKLPEFVSSLVAARNALRSHFKNTDLQFNFDGNLVGDLGEAIAAELFSIKLSRRGSAGIDGVAPCGRTVQVKATGVSGDPAFTWNEIKAEILLFLNFDFDNLAGEVVYNGPLDSVLTGARFAQQWQGQRQISYGKVKAADTVVADRDRLSPTNPSVFE